MELGARFVLLKRCFREALGAQLKRWRFCGLGVRGVVAGEDAETVEQQAANHQFRRGSVLITWMTVVEALLKRA